MVALHDVLREKTFEWKAKGWASEDYPVIAEILEWASNPDGSGYILRPPQFQALQVYWYLRLIEKTPRFRDLYHKFMPSKTDLLQGHRIPSFAGKAKEVGA